MQGGLSSASAPISSLIAAGQVIGDGLAGKGSNIAARNLLTTGLVIGAQTRGHSRCLALFFLRRGRAGRGRPAADPPLAARAAPLCVQARRRRR